MKFIVFLLLFSSFALGDDINSKLIRARSEIKLLKSDLVFLDTKIESLRNKITNDDLLLKKNLLEKDSFPNQKNSDILLEENDFKGIYKKIAFNILKDNSRSIYLNKNDDAVFQGFSNLNYFIKASSDLQESPESGSVLEIDQERLESLEKENQELVKQIDLNKDNLKKYKKEKGLIEDDLAKLRSQELKHETLLKSTDSQDKNTLVISKKSNVKSNTEYEGAGLIKGECSWPLKLKDVLTRVSPKKYSKKGIEFNLDKQESVYAIADGIVAHSSKIPVFGNTIILYHGDRFYSLYGKLSDILVSNGDLIQVGEDIARTSENLQDKFYFEIRLADKALNPLDYLK